MKKIILIAAVLSAAILSGCSQEMKVTVYNSNPMWGAQWVAINAHTQGHDQWFWPTTQASKADECDATNSITFDSKENETLTVGANGQYYIVDGTGNTSLSDFVVPATTQLLYGGFLEAPHWYAEVNLKSVITYKK